MKLHQKLTTFIVLFGIGMGTIGYYFLNGAQSALQQRVGKEVHSIARSYMETLDRILFLRVESVEALAHERMVVEFAEQSNAHYDGLPDRDKLIDDIDRAWVDGTPHPFIDSVLNNELSRSFARKIQFFDTKHQHDVFTELLAANRYGLTFAVSPKSSDFYQADEDWFSKSMQVPNSLVEDVRFDESTQMHSLAVSVKIRNAGNQVAGVLKGGINLEAIRETLDHFQADSQYKSFQYYLVDERGRVILSSRQTGDLSKHGNARMQPFGRDLSNWEPVRRALLGQSGYLYEADSETDGLIGYVPSWEGLDFKDLHWSLVLKFDAEEVLGLVYALKRNLEWMFGLGILLFAVVTGLFVISITRPVRKLIEGTRALGEGNWSVDLDTSSKDEIGELARAFESMASRLQKYTNELEEQVRARTQEYLKAKQNAEKANRAKSVFLSNMNHEIRTPLNAIMGYTQILQCDKNLNETQIEKMGSIYRSGKHLLSVINDVLDVSKIEAGKLKLNQEDFDLTTLVADLKKIHQWQCDQKDIRLVVKGIGQRDHILVHGDEGKLRQVLINLVGNAAKFTDQGQVMLKVLRRGDDQFYFEVADTGCGIALENQQRVFDPFQQEDVGMRKGGTGLGLSISKRIVDLMGGTLMLKSKPGVGTRFYFVLTLPPAKAVVAEQDRRLSAVTGLAAGCRVHALVVDDTPSSVRVLEEMLTHAGAKTRTAVNGPEALDQLQTWKPDIVFLDYQMPGMNGVELAAQIKNQFGNESIRIVMVTASVFDHDHDLFLKQGLDAVLKKPVEREELLGTLKELLNVTYEYGGPQGGIENEGKPVNIDFGKIKIPESVCISLKHNARLGKIPELEKQISELEQFDGEVAKMVRKLKHYISRFDTRKVITILDQVYTETS